MSQSHHVECVQDVLVLHPAPKCSLQLYLCVNGLTDCVIQVINNGLMIFKN